jgi:hypothetical protein
MFLRERRPDKPSRQVDDDQSEIAREDRGELVGPNVASS